MPQVTEHNAATGETIVREMTETEIAQYESDQLAIQEMVQSDADRAALKTATLAKLGLTADEVTALLS